MAETGNDRVQGAGFRVQELQRDQEAGIRDQITTGGRVQGTARGAEPSTSRSFLNPEPCTLNPVVLRHSRKQRHSNSLAARIWSGKPKQSIHPSSLARHWQSQVNSKPMMVPPASTSTTPVKSAQPETPRTRMASTSSAGSVESSWAMTRRTLMRGARGRTMIRGAWPVAARARTSRLKSSVALEAPRMCSMSIGGWNLIP